MALDRINATALLDGGVTSAKLATQTGNVDFADGGRIRLGDSQDLQIYHNGSNSYIDDTGTGNLYIRASDSVRLQSSTGEQGVLVASNGAVTLYYDNASKLATTSGGVTVTGTASATTFSGDLNGTINTATTATTQSSNNNTTKIATTAFVQQ